MPVRAPLEYRFLHWLKRGGVWGWTGAAPVLRARAPSVEFLTYSYVYYFYSSRNGGGVGERGDVGRRRGNMIAASGPAGAGDGGGGSNRRQCRGGAVLLQGGSRTSPFFLVNGLGRKRPTLSHEGLMVLSLSC